MAKDKLIIIGAGVAGLSAGCYARMNGYDVTIFERHSLPGLDDFHMVGQWASASLGVSTVAMMGDRTNWETPSASPR